MVSITPGDTGSLRIVGAGVVDGSRCLADKLAPDWPHGVPHGGELVFPFNTGGTAFGTTGKFTDADREMASKVANYWFTFAQTGTPVGTVPWPRHRMPLLQPQEDRTLRLGKEIKPESDFRRTRLELYALMHPEFVKWLEGRTF